VGVPGQFKKPHLAAGRLRDLNDALHALHLIAGQPSLETMHRLLGKRISRTRLHDAFTEPRLPPWDTVDALVEILASRAPGRTPHEVLPEVHALWVLAAQQRSLIDSEERVVSDQVTEIFGMVLGRTPRELRGDVPVVEYGCDSSATLEVMGRIQEVFRLTFDDEAAGDFMAYVTIDEAIRLTLQARRSAQGDDEQPVDA